MIHSDTLKLLFKFVFQSFDLSLSAMIKTETPFCENERAFREILPPFHFAGTAFRKIKTPKEFGRMLFKLCFRLVA